MKCFWSFHQEGLAELLLLLTRVTEIMIKHMEENSRLQFLLCLCLWMWLPQLAVFFLPHHPLVFLLLLLCDKCIHCWTCPDTQSHTGLVLTRLYAARNTLQLKHNLVSGLCWVKCIINFTTTDSISVLKFGCLIFTGLFLLIISIVW